MVLLMRLTTVLLTYVLLTTNAAFPGDVNTPSDIRFNDDIRPILSEHCFACHGPDSASRKADLRLDQRETALDSGAIVPGKADKSELIARITSDDPEVVMPPPSFRKPLSNAQKKLLSRWIEAGAKYQKHWAFITPQRPDLPNPAGVKAWARNPIDHFILRRLSELKLKPNDPADRHRLARRAALDITGLPPERELLDSFIRDEDEGAYERYVDRLLASKHAGEHRARFWLDAARYGDTHGMHVDNYREMWPYRDWVVKAFNSNMPFDQFVIEQIAGDMLPKPTIDQRIATGFSRCNITTSEGGAIPAELEVRYMVDRVETTATVFLGLTAGCAVCHDHKYDPISQREFYRLGAFFNNSTSQIMDGNQKDTPPVVTLPGEEHKDEWSTLLARRAELQKKIDGRFGNSLDQKPAADWWEQRQKDIEHPVNNDGLLLALPLTEDRSDQVGLPKGAVWADDHPAGRRGMRFADGSSFETDLPALRADEPLTISFWIRTPDRLLGTVMFQHMGKTDDKKTAGWQVTGNTQGGVSFEMTDPGGKKIRALLPGESALTPRAWQHVCIRYSGGQSNSSVTISVGGETRVLRNSTETYVDAAPLPAAKLKIAGKLPTGSLSDIRIFRRWLPIEEVKLLAREFGTKYLLKSDKLWNELSPVAKKQLAQYHAGNVDEASQTLLTELAGTQRRRDFIYSRSTTTMVMQERPSKPSAFVLQRGEYDQRQEEVGPGVPAVLPALPDDAPANRLALARWLVDGNHPLTARVFVNRLWQSIFGTGLVKTSEDFGVMGDRPSHPELLDWLAAEFVESGWDVRHLLRLIVTSAAYQQNGVVTAEKLKADRDNRFLSRGPRIRLDAEVLRDQALAVSGLLRRDFGGPSVKPYQPAGLWKVVAITGSNTRIFNKDSGDALYRRSLYTFWKRTSPPPSMAAFNAPTREQCTVRRERTNTPIQALVLMNDPQFVEAARRLAENTIRKQKEAASRAALMIETVLSRPASEDDIADMASLAVELQQLFEDDSEGAKKLITTGDTAPDKELNPVELAAWTMIANTLMNRDDFINK